MIRWEVLPLLGVAILSSRRSSARSCQPTLSDSVKEGDFWSLPERAAVSYDMRGSTEASLPLLDCFPTLGCCFGRREEEEGKGKWLLSRLTEHQAQGRSVPIETVTSALPHYFPGRCGSAQNETVIYNYHAFCG